MFDNHNAARPQSQADNFKEAAGVLKCDQDKIRRKERLQKVVKAKQPEKSE